MMLILTIIDFYLAPNPINRLKRIDIVTRNGKVIGDNVNIGANAVVT